MLNSYHRNHYVILSQIIENYNDVGDLYIYSNMSEKTFENVINELNNEKFINYDKAKNFVSITDFGIKILEHLKYIFPKTISMDKYNSKTLSPKGHTGWFNKVEVLDDNYKEIPELSKLYWANILEYHLTFFKTLVLIKNSSNRNDLQTLLNTKEDRLYSFLNFLIKFEIIKLEESSINKSHDTFKLTNIGEFLLGHLRELFYDEHITAIKDN